MGTSERKELAALIKAKGVEAFDLWRKRDDFEFIRFPLEYADLRGMDLSRQNLDQANFFMASLEGAKLIDTQLYAANFTGARLKGAELRSSDAKNASFIQADLTRADLADVELHAAKFDSACLRNTDFSGARIAAASFVRAGLQGASFRGASLETTDLRYANLTGTDFTDAELESVSLGRVVWGDKNPKTLWSQLERARTRTSLFVTLPTLKQKQGIICVPGPGRLDPYKKTPRKKRPF